MVKKTLGDFDVKIKTLYSYGVYVIDTFFEHCKLLAMMEEEDIGITEDMLPGIASKRQFEHYIVESKNFKSLYLEGNPEVEALNAVPTWEQLKESREKRTRILTKNDDEEIRKMEYNIRVAYQKSITQVIGRAYYTCKIFYFCLFWGLNKKESDIVENECALLHVVKLVCDMHRV